MSLLAATAKGDLVFRGRSPDAALASAAPPWRRTIPGSSAGRSPAAAAATAPQRLIFDAPPGKIELRMTVEAAGAGGTLDSEIRDITVPDFTAPQVAISTPRVYRARTVREFQTLAADAAAMPSPGREFSRTERLLIRFDAYGAGTEQPQVDAVLLNRGGQKMSDVPVAPGRRRRDASDRSGSRLDSVRASISSRSPSRALDGEAKAGASWSKAGKLGKAVIAS